MEEGFEDGEGGGGGGGNMCTACICMLIGLALYPAALGFSGWNEKRAVCREKALYEAEGNSKLLSCSSHADVDPGDLGFLSCALDKTTLTNYSNEDIKGLQDLSLKDLFHAPGLGLRVTTEMVVCKEKCIKEVCEGRRLSEQGRNDTEMEDGDYESFTQVGDNEVESFPEAGAATSTEPETNTIPARRLNGGRRRRTCTNKCVKWGYWLDWSDQPGSSSFNDQAKAEQNCTGPNPQAPFSVALGISNKYADAGQVKVQGGGWSLNKKQTKAIPVNVPVTMTATGDLSLPQVPWTPAEAWTKANTMVIGNELHTCKDKELGCMRLSAWVSRPGKVALLGEVSQTPGLMSEDGWEAPADWLCSGQTVQRVCPTSAAGDLMQGGFLESCGEIDSKEELFEVMHGENSFTTWIYRLVGFLLTWLGIYFICQPITTCVQMSGDFLDQITECIPGVGCIVDEMTDIFTGLVTGIICAVACFCACSSFLFVAAVAWVVMRPMVAIPLLILGLCLCGGAGFLMHTFRKKRAKTSDAEQALLIEDS